MLAAHPTAIQISDVDRNNAPINNIDVHDNLFANNDHRNPNGITSGLKVVNNVIYNWHQGAGQGEKVHHRLDRELLQGRSHGGAIRLGGHDFITSNGPIPSYYVTGNVGPHNSDPYAGSTRSGVDRTAS